MNYNEIMRELAQYTRVLEEAQAVVDGLKDQLKAYMTQNSLETLSGDEHKASYKPVITNRIDSSALKRDLPDIAKEYTKQTCSMRFTFV